MHGGEAVRGAGVPVTVTPIGAVVPLTASFAAPTPGAEPVPASHDGSTAFTLRILFSEPIGISYATLRDESLQATGGTVRKAQRVGGRNDLWDIEVAPSSAADVVVVLPATSGCGAAAAVCTRDGKPLSHGLEATIPGTAPVPLTAEFRNVPSSHAGSGTFTLELSFSEPIAVSYRTLRDESLQATGGAVRKARRVNGSSKLWELEIAPSSSAEVVVVLPATSGCGAAAAVCTRDGQPLSNRVEAAIPGPPQPEVSIVAAAGPVTEAGASAFTLTRTGETAAALSVEVSVTETGAMLAAGAPTSVTFGAGASEQALSVGTDDDTVVEEASTVTVVVAAGAGYAVASGSGSAQVTVEDNDTAEFELSVDPAEIAEGESSTVTASIANGVTFASDQTIALEFTGTATKGTDYTVSAETLALSAGAGSASVTVTAVADEDEEDGETVEVAAEHGGAGIGGATVTISADEAPPPDDAAPEGFALAANENPHGAWSDGRLLWVARRVQPQAVRLPAVGRRTGCRAVTSRWSRRRRRWACGRTVRRCGWRTTPAAFWHTSWRMAAGRLSGTFRRRRTLGRRASGRTARRCGWRSGRSRRSTPTVCRTASGSRIWTFRRRRNGFGGRASGRTVRRCGWRNGAGGSTPTGCRTAPRFRVWRSPPRRQATTTRRACGPTARHCG